MHIRSGNGQDIILAPQGAGVVQVVSALDVAEALTVGNTADPLMVADPETRTVHLGTAQSRADVTVTGDVSFSDTLTIQNGGIQVLNGDVRFGNANQRIVVDCKCRPTTRERGAREGHGRIHAMPREHRRQQRAHATIERVKREDIRARAVDAIVREALVVLRELDELARRVRVRERPAVGHATKLGEEQREVDERLRPCRRRVRAQ